MILLTGATGYLGSQIAQELIRRRVRFRVLVREPARLGFDPAASGCQVVAGDLLDAGRLNEALGGVDVVIHAAALVKMWVRDRREFRRVNLEGLKSLLRAATAAGARRVVYTSSFIALGPSSDPQAGESLVHGGPFSNEYEMSKFLALQWLRTEGFAQYPVIALLPGALYGPGPMTEGNLVGGMVAQYLAGRFPGLLGSGEQRWSFSWMDDVVAAHLVGLEQGTTGRAYLVAGDNRSLNELFRLVAEISGVRHRVRHLPFWVGKIMGGAGLAGAQLFSRPPRLTPGVVDVFKHDWVYSSTQATRELNYRVTRLEEGLAQMLPVFRAATDC